MLILAGELVFGLPFHTARFFRPSMLEVFGFTNTQLGDLFALYGMRLVLARPVVWLQAAVIVCAYCGYKGLDNYSLYAVQVIGMNELEAAGFVAWVRTCGRLLPCSRALSPIVLTQRV